MLELTTPVQYVKGIGPRLAEILATKGIATVGDLLYYLPFRYEDRLNPRGIAELRAGEMATVIGEVRNSGLFRTRKMPIFQLTVGQGRSKLKCLWFNATYLQDKFKPGQLIALYGKVEQDSRSGELQIMQPQFEMLGDGPGDAADDKAAASLEVGRIVPIYESAGQGQVTARWFRRIIRKALEDLTPDIAESIPEAVRSRLALVSPREALWQVHWPEAGESFEDLQSSRTPAHIRMIFEELFFIELGLELKRRQQKTETGIAFRLDDRVRQAIKKILPFHPTAAQKRVLKEIADDMQKPYPMRRLLQGDVGSGKTIIGFQAAIIAIENGCQVALMAPTEILAQQHYFSARRILENAGYRIVLLTGSLEADRKREVRRHIAQGNAQLVIGTHALLEEKVEFAKPGLVIVDEQHRFGVLQRLKLMKKSGEGSDQKNPAEPDVLVMTATPIPRTLALTLYGDLDLSVLDELPPGRTPIVTRRVAGERQEEVWEFVRKQVAQQRQAYIVYPVIEGARDDQPELDFAAADVTEGEAKVEATPKAAKKVRKSTKASKGKLFADVAEPAAKPNGKLDLRSATEMYEQLRHGALSGLRVGLLHGRLDADEKDVVMRRFNRGETDVLVATTVIEVGVDVPNATVMVVDHAERFGLAQLHQLRGRVGRGAAKSYCILMTGQRVSEQAEERLAAMVRTQNGFELAELDLTMRGPGEFFGTRQAGLPGFRVANLVRDRDLLELAKQEASRFASSPDETVTEAERKRVWDHLRHAWQRRYGLMEAG
jgi:ATP-dependent DNA helicase RecG